jgi:hypothetical protein
MDKDSVHNKNAVKDNSADEPKSSDAIKDIKKEMHRYEEKIKSGETSVGDTTRSEE